MRSTPHAHPSVAAFLRSTLAAREAAGPYSLRQFAKDLALSPAFLSQLLHGKKHLSLERRLDVAKRLGLDDPGTRYFYLLAQHEEAPSDAIRAEIEVQLNDLRHSYAEEAIDADHFDAISAWFHIPILEMSYLDGFTVRADTVAQLLGITELAAQAAIERLERLQLLASRGDGTYTKTETNVVFRTSRPNEAFARFHRQMIALGREAVDLQPVGERLIMSQTFCIDQSQLAEAREVTRQYLQRMAGLFETAPARTRTYQLNVQFFNLTDGRAKGEIAAAETFE